MVALVPYAVFLTVAVACWKLSQRYATRRPRTAAVASFVVVMAVLYVTLLVVAVMSMPADFHDW